MNLDAILENADWTKTTPDFPGWEEWARENPELPSAYLPSERLTATAWDETKHPRHPAGSEEGGEFAPKWGRQDDGSYAAEGWTITKEHSRGSGQAKAFERVTRKAGDSWVVRDPGGTMRAQGSTLANAKQNAARQIALAGEREASASLLREALHSWVGYPSDMRIHMANELSGAPEPDNRGAREMRAQARALLREVRDNGRPTDVRLYRGAPSLHQQVPVPQSWTPKKSVARRYSGGAEPFELPAGAARGIKMSDYISPPMNDNEQQWLLDPRSFPQGLLGAAWDESKHPRHPAGSEEGGEFAPRGDTGGYQWGPGTTDMVRGIPVFVEDGVADAAALRSQLYTILDSTPTALLGKVKQVNIAAGASPNNDLWEAEYQRPGFEVYASADFTTGQITFWNPKYIDRGGTWHEMGHLMHQGGGPGVLAEWGTARWKDSLASQAAHERIVAAEEHDGDLFEGKIYDKKTVTYFGSRGRSFILGDQAVTDYGRVNSDEDWAESVELYVEDASYGGLLTIKEDGFRRIIRFKDIWPERAKILREEIGL